MDVITKVPGLQHISEDIFKLLDKKSLMNCRLTNSSWKNVSKMSIFWLKKMKMEGWTTLAKYIEDRQIAKDFTTGYLNVCSLIQTLGYLNFEYFRSDIQSQWKVLLTKLENYHKQKDSLVLILIKIYNNRHIILPLELVLCLTEAYKYPELVEAMLMRILVCSKVDIDYFLWIALHNATKILLAAFDGFTGLVEKLSIKHEDPLVETSRG